MPLYKSKGRFFRDWFLILTSKNNILSRGGQRRLILDAARYRYNGHHLIYLHVYIKVGFLGSEF
jgi:hypothetical protein